MRRTLCVLVAGLVRLAVGSGRSKDVEIIVLGHELAVLRRQVDRPASEDGDRTLLGAVARRCLAGPVAAGSSNRTRCWGGIAGGSPVTGPIGHDVAGDLPRQR